jgi:hypothetical protein
MHVCRARNFSLSSARTARHCPLPPQAARELLGPLLDAACARLAFVMRRSVDAGAERTARTCEGRELLRPYTVRWACRCGFAGSN